MYFDAGYLATSTENGRYHRIILLQSRLCNFSMASAEREEFEQQDAYIGFRWIPVHE
jgi:hypothetical protein